MRKLTQKGEHPASLFNKVRHHVFSVYEKTHDLDRSFEILEKYRLIRPSKYGLKAELLFYDKYYKELKLDPLLDAGVKADFSGVRDNRIVNIDVTTNLQYKDINKYVDVVQRKNKRYEIALMNLKSEEVEFFPLRFPICPDCGKFSHYVLFMSRPSNDVTWSMSTSQALIRHCPMCDEFEIIKEYSDYVPSIMVGLEDIESLQTSEETRDPKFNLEKYLLRESIPIVQTYESESQRLISVLSEGDYIVTDPRDGDGYYGGRILWAHPLANRFFGATLDYDYYDGSYTL
jgi:hypothetical protein